MKRLISILMAVILLLGLSACGNSKELSESGNAAGQETSKTPETATPPETVSNGITPALIIDVNGTIIKADLYDNQAARSFMELLPYSVSVTRAANDLCGAVTEQLDVNPKEDSGTWKIGEIGWFDGWFTILCDNEDGMRQRTRTIIGKIRDEDISFVQSIEGTVTMKISLENTENTSSDHSRDILVAYFSRTGTTESLAKYAAEYLNADIFEIEAAVPYSDEDIAYYTDCRADREQNDKSARPEIAGSVSNMDQYDTIILGYPIWHGQAPRIIYTFMESYDFAGKTIVPFCTSHSSDIGSSDTYLHGLVSGDVEWREGRRFEAGTSKDTISAWLDELGIKPFQNEVNIKAGQFDFEAKTVLLNSGYEMPIMGLGTYSLDHDTCVSSVKALLENGGRLIDTAYMYGNEDAVGEGVRQAMEEYGILREDIFVITKIYPSQFDDPEAAIDMALEKLDIGYIDMMLLHHPGAGDVEAYKTMEKYVEQGKIHSLGLSNWYVEELTDFLPQVNVTPALVQNEIHPYYQEQDVVPFIQEKGIAVQCWYPLGGRGHTAELLVDETIIAIADSHSVSSAQVILRWDLQRGIVVIPGSSNPEHIKENLDIFDFELTDEEMERISQLDRNEKHDWY